MVTRTCSCFSVGNLKNASQCAGTYKMFRPDDDVMAENIEFYKSQANITDNDFNPRQVLCQQQPFCCPFFHGGGV